LFKDGDFVTLIPLFRTKRKIRYTIKLKRGEKLSTNYGIISHDEILDRDSGSVIQSHIGKAFIIIDSLLEDKIKNFKGFKHITQIIYPRDWGLILSYANIKPTEHIVEIGTGSGAFLAFLSELISHENTILSFEKEEERLKIAKENLDKISVPRRFTIKKSEEIKKIKSGSVDVVFADIPAPWNVVDEVWRILRGGGRFIIYVPTFNQVKKAIIKLIRSGFVDIRVIEGFVRELQYIPYAIRPLHRGYIFSAYIIFSRKSYVIPKKYLEMLKNEI